MTNVRILRDVPVDGVSYAPNDLVDLPADKAKQLVADGAADDSKDAVAYCKTAGAKLIKHKPKAEEQPKTEQPEPENVAGDTDDTGELAE